MNIDTRHSYLRLDIKRVENINLAMNEEINGVIEYIDEVESLAECKNILLDLMVNTREQMNILKSATDDLHNLNNSLFLNGALKPSEHINVNSDMNYKKALIRVRY